MKPTPNETWNIVHLMRLLGNRRFVTEASDELRRMVDDLTERASLAASNAKGKLTIEIDAVAGPDGMVVFDPNIKATLPRKVRATTPMWVGADGLTQSNPNQQALFGELREVVEDDEERREKLSR